MELKARNDIRSLIVDPDKFVPELTEQKVRMLHMELLMLMREYERDNAIMYLASNYSTNKHLSFIVLRGMHDGEIKTIMQETKDYLDSYLELLKKNV